MTSYAVAVYAFHGRPKREGSGKTGQVDTIYGEARHDMTGQDTT